MTLRRRLRIFAAFTAVALLGAGCAMLEETERELIFRPNKTEWWGYRNGGNVPAFEERWIPVNGNGDGNGNGERLHAWWTPGPQPDAPVLLYLHGARWNLTGSATRIPRWQRLGFAVLAIDYRGFGKSEGDMPSETSVYEDAQAAWDYLKRTEPARKRFLHGHSLGGAVAIEMARRNPDAAGLIAEATFTSIPDMARETKWGFLPVDHLITQRFDSMAKIREVRIPTLFVHGVNDAIVPVEMSRKLYAASGAPKKLIIVEGGNHHNLTSVAFDDVRAALQELFGMQPAVRAGS